jgi:ubiquinone/menaquinone biosynthesis C-methylase UbiE
MSVKLYKQEWDKSYNRFENHILYPKEEVVKFLNRFVRKKLSEKTFQNKIKINDGGSIRGLDYGCGIGRMTILMHEFNIDSFGVDISKSAIQKAKELYPILSKNFTVVDGERLPYEDSYFDISICESVIDSMHFTVAKKVIKELDRVTNKLTFISFISGDDSEHYREYSGDEIVRTKHEKDTVQCWYNWTKINDLLSNTNYKIKWARLVTEESLIDSYKYGRYNVVLEK